MEVAVQLMVQQLGGERTPLVVGMSMCKFNTIGTYKWVTSTYLILIIRLLTTGPLRLLLVFPVAIIVKGCTLSHRVSYTRTIRLGHLSELSIPPVTGILTERHSCNRLWMVNVCLVRSNAVRCLPSLWRGWSSCMKGIAWVTRENSIRGERSRRCSWNWQGCRWRGDNRGCLCCLRWCWGEWRRWSCLLGDCRRRRYRCRWLSSRWLACSTISLLLLASFLVGWNSCSREAIGKGQFRI